MISELISPLNLYSQSHSVMQTTFIKEDVRCMVIGPDCRFVAVSSGTHDTKIYFYDLNGKRQREATQNNRSQPSNAAAIKRLIQSADTAMEVIEGGQFVNYQMNLSPDGKLSPISVVIFESNISVSILLGMELINIQLSEHRIIQKGHSFMGYQVQGTYETRVVQRIAVQRSGFSV